MIPEKEQTGCFYEPDTAAGRLERHLKANGIESIGDPNYLTNKYPDRIESVVAPVTFLNDDDRRLRAMHMTKLTYEKIETWHEKERKDGGFAMLPGYGFFMGEVTPMKFTAGDRERFDKIIQGCAPRYDKQFQGFPIPPSFSYDYEFDVIEYQHDWDKAIWKQREEFRPGQSSIMQELEKDDGRYGS